jgi:hypothetical protein
LHARVRGRDLQHSPFREIEQRPEQRPVGNRGVEEDDRLVDADLGLVEPGHAHIPDKAIVEVREEQVSSGIAVLEMLVEVRELLVGRVERVAVRDPHGVGDLVHPPIVARGIESPIPEPLDGGRRHVLANRGAGLRHVGAPLDAG